MALSLALRRPLWAALALLQAGACGLQLARGFVPLRRAPGRVALSWDMFAPAVTRCTLAFAPPLAGLPGVATPGALASLHQLALPLEWDLVYDRREDYLALGCALCQHAGGPGTRMHLTCFTPDGRRRADELPCP